MGQDAPRSDVDPVDGLLDFGSEAPNADLDNKEWDLALGSKEPDSGSARREEIVFNSQERDIASVPTIVWHSSVPVDRKSASLKIGIALVVLVSIIALAWSGRSLMGMRQPTATLPLEAPANVSPS